MTGLVGTETTTAPCLEMVGSMREQGRSAALQLAQGPRPGLLLPAAALAPIQMPSEQEQQAPTATSVKLAGLGCTMPAGNWSPVITH